MAYTHHSDAMTSALNNVQLYECLKCASHAILLFLDFLVLHWAIPSKLHFKCFYL